MMASNVAAAETGGYPEPPTDNWWLSKYSNWLSTIGSVALAFVGCCGIAFNLISLSPISAAASAIQVLAAAIILSIEGSSLVSFLMFAMPIKNYFDGRPLYVKTAVFAGLTVFPMLLGPSGLSVMLGFMISASITALYGMILIGRKGNIDDMVASAEQPKI